jgi:AcrR family transcriptional regulator
LQGEGVVYNQSGKHVPFETQGRNCAGSGKPVKNTKADRRSRRTRQLLSAALVELMLEKRYDQITVQDIIERADVGRSTFYAHYLDKDDLLVSDFRRVLDSLGDHVRLPDASMVPTPPPLAYFFEHVQQHHHLYKALVRGGGINLLYKQGHAQLRQTIEQHLGTFVPAGQPPAVPLELVTDYLAGAILNLLTWWLDHGMPYTPQQMDALFHQLVLPGVQATLRLPAMHLSDALQGGEHKDRHS